MALLGHVPVLFLVGVLGTGMAIMSCDQAQSEFREYTEYQKTSLMGRQRARPLIKTLEFVKHENGLCFAVAWGGYVNGGPAMTLVPSEYCPPAPPVPACPPQE